MPEPVHLALGDSATGCLRIACESHGLPGAVLNIPDDLSHGPLDDGSARIKYMRSCYQGYDEWLFDVPDAFTPWRKAAESLDREEPEAILIWSGDNVSETTFLAMACWKFRQRPEPVLHLAVPPGPNGLYAVAAHEPAELADLYPARRELANSERILLSEEFERIRRETGLLRRWENGRIIGVPEDYYDRLVLGACASAWIQAPRVIGTAMSRCDPHNMMSDLFFSSRLQTLIEAGQIEADGVRTRMRGYAVRLSRF